MAKKTIKKSHSTIKRKNPSRPTLNLKETSVENILIENFVSLQKVMTNLSVKFDSLTKQISQLLELFEISAKALAKKDLDLGKDKNVIEKIDNLLDQNKIIARGLTLMNEKVLGKQIDSSPVQNPEQIPPPQDQKPSVNMGEYQKSISSENLSKQQDSSQFQNFKPKKLEKKKNFLGR